MSKKYCFALGISVIKYSRLNGYLQIFRVDFVQISLLNSRISFLNGVWALIRFLIF